MKYNHLTQEQRYTISRCLTKGLKQKEIAELIGVSPSTISRELKRNATKRGKYNHNYAQISLSHETIYKWIRKDKRDGGDLYKNCRHKLKKRKRGIYASSSTIPEKVSIHERPMEVDGNRFGDFEMDTIVSAGSKAILLTIVEISTSMIFMEKMDTGKKPKEIAKASIISLKKTFEVNCTWFLNLRTRKNQWKYGDIGNFLVTSQGVIYFVYKEQNSV